MLSLFRIILNSNGKESWLLSTERENPEQDRTGISRANVDPATPELQLHRKVYALPLPEKVSTKGMKTTSDRRDFITRF
jgi:hypothetical protein